MNRLITTHHGGMPNHLENHRWFEDSLIATFKNLALAIGLGDSAFILHGVKVTQNSSYYFITEGAIFMNGIIYRVPSHQLSKLGSGQDGTYFWDIEKSYDPSGHVQFQNQEWYNIYELQVAKLQKTTEVLDAGTYTPLALKSLSSILTSRAAYDTLLADYNDTKNAALYWYRNNGAGYYSVNLQGPSETFPSYQSINFTREVGTLRGTTHLRLRAGGIYKITVHKGADLSLRLFGGLGYSFPLVEGDNIITNVFAVVAGFLEDRDVVFQQLTTGDVSISAILLGIDYSVTTGSEETPVLFE